VTIISPGFVRTNFAEGVTSPEAKVQRAASRDKVAVPLDTVAGAICHRLDVYSGGGGGRFVDRLCGFLVVFIIGEFFFVPGVVAEGGVGDAAGVDYYLLGAGLKGGAA